MAEDGQRMSGLAWSCAASSSSILPSSCSVSPPSFLCPCLEMCNLRRRFAEQFAGLTGRLSCPRSADTALKPYLTLPGRIYIGNTGAFYFDNTGAEDVKLFLLKQTY